MVNQTPISVRIYNNLLEDLKSEAALGYRKQSQLINDAIAHYLPLLDLKRSIRCHASSEKGAQILLNYINVHILNNITPDSRREILQRLQNII